MDNKGQDKTGSPVVHKVLALLDDLKVSPSGAIVYGHIEQMLSEMVADNRKTEDAYASFLAILMEACLSLVPAESPLHTHLRLVQMRLSPPLSVSELGILNRSVEAVADELAQSVQLRGRDLVPALTPVLERFGGVPQGVAGVNAATAGAEPASTQEPSSRWTRADEADADLDEHDNKVDQQVNSAYRAHLDEKREEMQKLQQDFVAQMSEAVAESENFSRLLDDVQASLQQAATIEDLEARRVELVQSLDSMIMGHKALGEKFSRAQEYLSIIEDDNQQLSDELDRVRLLSLTDDLTRLPNRRAFLRRLEDEVSRVQRHGYPLSLVLMDLDYFKRINDLRGHAAGDEVLRIYAAEILSIFRHHDLVARYGGEEFAVLLPNTDYKGVICALDKVRRRVEEVDQARGEDAVPLATFSAGVAEFRAGETPNSLIERADSALYAAKHNGRNRTEVSGISPGVDAPMPSRG